MAATNTTQIFADAGILFNDATRFVEGGVWQTTVSEGGQGLGSAAHVVSDLQQVKSILQAGVETGQYSNQALTDVQHILGNLDQEIAAVNASLGGGNVAAAYSAIRSLHLDTLGAIAADATLAAAANGVQGFQAAPPTLADGPPPPAPATAASVDTGAVSHNVAALHQHIDHVAHMWG
jgi:hypothetical protein